MSHEIEHMMYTGKTPWHGLGVRLLTAPSTTAKAIERAGLDWQIALQRLQLPDGRPVDRNAVIRTSDSSVLGTVGMNWEPVQNREAFQPLDAFLQAGVTTIETAGSLRDGRRVWMLARINRPDSVIVPQADDRVAKYLLVAIGHDGTLAFRMGLTPIRVVCSNILSIALRAGDRTHVRYSHTADVHRAIRTATDTIAAIDARFEGAADVFRQLAAVPIRSEADLRRYVDAVYYPNKAAAAEATATETATIDGGSLLSGLLDRPIAPKAGIFSPEIGVMTKETKSRVYEEVARLFESGQGNNARGVRGTAWAAYNAVTEHLTWHRGRSQDARLENVWMGAGENAAGRALPAAIGQFLQ